MAGIPVAVTLVGGNPEIVIDGESGWTVPSGDVDALAAAIRDSARDEGKRKALSAAGKRRFERHFSFDRMIDDYRKQYRMLLSTNA
jgi:glycosyltransferase involved in cell wall biosynthesis